MATQTLSHGAIRNDNPHGLDYMGQHIIGMYMALLGITSSFVLAGIFIVWLWAKLA